MTADSFDAHFDLFTWTATRLQTLPAYDVGGAEAERIRAWWLGLPRPERSVRTDPWLARIAVTTATGGKRWAKLCVVDDPLTPYQRQQLLALTEDQAAGNRILLAHRADVPDHGPDVWLFDAGTAAAHALVMHYTPDGRWLGYEDVTDPRRVAEITDVVRCVEAHAVPLNAYLAAVTSAA